MFSAASAAVPSRRLIILRVRLQLLPFCRNNLGQIRTSVLTWIQTVDTLIVFLEEFSEKLILKKVRKKTLKNTEYAKELNMRAQQCWWDILYYRWTLMRHFILSLDIGETFLYYRWTLGRHFILPVDIDEAFYVIDGHWWGILYYRWTLGDILYNRWKENQNQFCGILC